MSTPLRYVVDLAGRQQHLVEITLTVPADDAPGARLVLPTWTPGSYVMRDYVHHLQWIRARDADGGDLPLIPDGHTAWRLPDDVDGAVTVTYEMYANSLTVRTNHVDDHHALIVGAASFVLVEGARDREHRVTIRADQRVWSLLPTVGDDHVAANADRLVDSAFEVADAPEVTVEVAGATHRFVWTGHGGAPDFSRIGEDLRGIAQAAVELFDDDLPLDEYTFLCVGWDEGGGGLEHRDGAVLMMPVTTFHEPDTYAKFQSLVAHEYLHLWNVKRLTPAELVRPAFDRHVHTTQLWVAEGWTAYYDELLSLRAGCWDLERYLKTMGETLDAVLERPGTALQSVEEASYHAWTKLYIRDENWVNAGTDYYAHGALLAWCLDLLIRDARPDSGGLDDALRALWREFGRRERGYTRADVAAAVSAAAGTDLSSFFTDHVRGRTLPVVEDLVGAVGLRIERPEPDEPTPRLGVQATEDDEGVTATAVLRGGPAWRAGVTGGDRILAIDGQRVPTGKLGPTLRGHAAGDTVGVTVARGPRVMTLPVVLDEPYRQRKLRPVPEPTDEQRTAFRQWTGRDLPDRERD